MINDPWEYWFEQSCVSIRSTMSAPDPFPSSIDLSLIDPSLISPVMPIPPEVFYGTPHSTSGNIPSSRDTSLCPPLHELQRSSGSSADPSQPPSPALGAHMKKSKKHEEFMLKDLNQLLCATIEVNPYAALRNLIGEAWKEVVQKAQAAGYCLGRDVDTCNNCVGMLLGWCEVHPTHLLFLSDNNIHAFYLGREGEEASIITHSPVRGQPGWLRIALRQNRFHCPPQA